MIELLRLAFAVMLLIGCAVAVGYGLTFLIDVLEADDD